MLVEMLDVFLLLIDVCMFPFLLYRVIGIGKGNWGNVKGKYIVFILLHFVLSYISIYVVMPEECGNLGGCLSFISIILPLFLCVIVLKLNVIDGFIAFLFYFVLVLVLQGCVVSVGTLVVSITGHTIEDNLFQMIAQIVYSSVYFLVIYLFRGLILSAYVKSVDYFKHKLKKAKLLRIVCVFFIFCMLAILTTQITQDKGVVGNSLVFWLCLGLMLLVFLFVFVYHEVIVTEGKAQMAEERAKMSEERAKMSEELANTLAEKNKLVEVHNDFVFNLNSFAQGYNNIIQTISFLINCEEISIEDVRPVLNDLVTWSEGHKLGTRLKYINIPNIMIASLLSVNLDKAESLGVKLDVKYEGKTPLDVNAKDFIDIFSILLDNSIQASYYTEEKTVYINLMFLEKEFEMRISNFFIVENGVVMKYGESRGIGLKNIYAIVDRIPEMSFETIVEEDKYTAILRVRKGEGVDVN